MVPPGSPTTRCASSRVPVGYGDGYFRSMSNQAQVIIRGKKYPQVGRICMDQMMVNIEADSAFNGDEVTLMGEREAESITAQDLADWAGTIPYEILTNINTRVRAFISRRKIFNGIPPADRSANRFNLGSIPRFLSEHSLDYLFLFFIGAVIIGLDQWTKALVRANVPVGSDWLPAGLAWLLPYARIRHWYNSGAAFGIFQNGNLVFSILAVIVILLILYYYPRTQRNDWWLRVAMAMQFAGAAGNLIDRLFL